MCSKHHRAVTQYNKTETYTAKIISNAVHDKGFIILLQSVGFYYIHAWPQWIYFFLDLVSRMVYLHRIHCVLKHLWSSGSSSQKGNEAIDQGELLGVWGYKNSNRSDFYKYTISWLKTQLRTPFTPMIQSAI